MLCQAQSRDLFADRLLSSGGHLHLVETMVALACSRTVYEPTLARIVAAELFHISFVNPKTRDLFEQLRDSFVLLCATHSAAVSVLLSSISSHPRYSETEGDL
jgi:hypothetical protein